ncbi:MAG: insulinase family protein, partial [Chloroflexi bacterium]|nr:insulinase family protein [Chloroflexota bacterium]
LDILSDLMCHATFDPDEVESERTVIISEREGSENNPAYQLYEEVNATAFHVHPYHQPVIGWQSDLRTMTRADLYRHYRTYYCPSNAVLVVVGDFESDAMLRQVEQYFARCQGNPPLPPVRSVEPPQQSERRVLIEKAGTTAYFRSVFHTPEATHADTPALIVLDAILSGGKSMSFFGGGVALNKSSRLYRALVETELAAEVSSNFGFNRDPSLFDVSATVREGRTLQEVEDAVFAELERVADKPPKPAELSKAVKQTRAQFAYSTERVSSLAYLLGVMECLHSHRDLSLFTERLADVSAQDVQRVAQTYLTKSNRTVGWFNPVSSQQ